MLTRRAVLEACDGLLSLHSSEATARGSPRAAALRGRRSAAATAPPRGQQTPQTGPLQAEQQEDEEEEQQQQQEEEQEQQEQQQQQAVPPVVTLLQVPPSDSGGASFGQRLGGSSPASGGSSGLGGTATPTFAEGAVASSDASGSSSLSVLAGMAALVTAAAPDEQEPPQLRSDVPVLARQLTGKVAPPPRKRGRSGSRARGGSKSVSSRAAAPTAAGESLDGPAAAAAAAAAAAGDPSAAPAAAKRRRPAARQEPAGGASGDGQPPQAAQVGARGPASWRYALEETSIELLQKEGVFDMNQLAAAKFLNMGITTLKTVLMPRLGLKRWPYRKRNTVMHCVSERLEEYLQRYGEAACKQYDIPRWTLAALLAHVRAQEAALTDYMDPAEMSQDMRALRQVLYKLHNETKRREPEDPKWVKDVSSLLKKWPARFELQSPTDAANPNAAAAAAAN